MYYFVLHLRLFRKLELAGPLCVWGWDGSDLVIKDTLISWSVLPPRPLTPRAAESKEGSAVMEMFHTSTVQYGSH